MKFNVGTYKRQKDKNAAAYLANRIRNMTKKELLKLFPQSTIILERFMGFTKSFIVHMGF